MTVTRKLTPLVLTSVFLVCLLGTIFHTGSEFRALADVLRFRIGSDSSRFMDRAWETLASDQPLYPTLFFEQHVKFIYPTSSILTYSLATLLHLRPSIFIQGLAVLSLPVTLLLAGEIFLLTLAGSKHEDPKGHLWIRLFIALLGLLFYPLAYSVQLGQIQAFLNLLWTLAIYLWLRDRRAFSGVCLALTCAFKPTLAIFMLWAALRRQRRFLISFAATCLFLQVIAVARFGWRNELDYIAVLSYISHRGEAFLPNQSVNGFLQRLTRNGDIINWSDFTYPLYRPFIYLGTLFSSLALIAFGLFAPILKKHNGSSIATGQETAPDFILFGLVATLASPIVWDTHYGYFFPASVFLLARLIRRGGAIPYTFLACYLVIANPISILNPFVQHLWTPLLNPYLYAGLGIILLLAFHPAALPDLPADRRQQTVTG